MKRKGGSVIIALFVAIAATLLFIPEIIRLIGGNKKLPLVVQDGKLDQEDTSLIRKKSDSAKSESKDRLGAKKRADDLLMVPPEESEEFPDTESFSQIINQIEEGEVALNPLGVSDKVVKDKGRGGEVREKDIESRVKDLKHSTDEALKEGDLTNGDLDRLGEPPLPPGRKHEREELRRVLLESEKVDWGVVKDPRVRKPLEGALKDSKVLLKVLNQKYVKSRFALINYIHALSGILSPAIPGMKFKELLQYIGLLDVRVTQSFIEERVPQTEYFLWRAISVGAFVESAGGKNEFDYIPSFAADLIITQLDLKILTDRYKKRAFELRVVGTVEGKDPTRVEVYRGKDVIKVIELPKPNVKDQEESYRTFNFNYTDTTGTKPYTFRVMNGKGNVLQKTYSLVALPMKRFEVDARGVFNIPVVPLPRPIGRPSTVLDDLIILGSHESAVEIRPSVIKEGGVLEYSRLDRRIARLKKF